jgi:hypothetical protein
MFGDLALVEIGNNSALLEIYNQSYCLKTTCDNFWKLNNTPQIYFSLIYSKDYIHNSLKNAK